MPDLSTALVLDLESTGSDPFRDRITQIAILPACHSDSPTGDNDTFVSLVNPGCPIPPHITELTGITDTAVETAPRFEEFAQVVADLLHERTLIGFGINGFDIPLLAEEFERAGVKYTFGPVLDAGVIYKRFESRTLGAAVRFYLGENLEDAHSAPADAIASGRVLQAQLRRYTDLGAKTVGELAMLSYLGDYQFADPAGKLVWIKGRLCFNTFRNRHVPVDEDRAYAEWMLRADFPTATLRMLSDYLNKPTEAERIDDAIAEAMAGDGLEIPF